MAPGNRSPARRLAAVVLLAGAAAALLYARVHRIDECGSLPEFRVVVGGSPVEGRAVSGHSFACGWIGDGAALDFLDPIPAQPGAPVVIVYETPVTWPELAYTVYREEAGEARVVAHRLMRRHLGFSLPREPGLYTVAIDYGWQPVPPALPRWLSRLGFDTSGLYGGAGGAQYFRVLVSP